MKQEVSAIVVARKGSVRVPGKNQLPLGGEPIFIRKIRQLQQCTTVDRVIFGSDSDEMLLQAKSIGAEVVRRPDFFCDEMCASANDMIWNMASSIKTDIVVWAHCTNPLISTATYDSAVREFEENWPEYDSLLSVVELKEHLWHEKEGGGFEPLNYNPYQARHVPARELPPYFMQDGGIFIQPHRQMVENRYFFGKKPRLFFVPQDEFLDINNMRDYMLAKAIIDAEHP